MNILGIETSCDETAVAVVTDGRTVLSNVIASSMQIHQAYGGVVPEIAARSHIEVMLPVISEAMHKAGTTWDDIDGIAVTAGPGLLGSLLIGTMTAQTIALIRKKPLYSVNHVVAHTFANALIPQTAGFEQDIFPLLSLSVSGGHSHMLIFEAPLKYSLIGRTRDDAAGEAFDKVAKMMGLPYPGGPSISRAALSGDEDAYLLPIPQLGDSLDFSFSGLKTAVLRVLQREVGGDFRTPSSELPSRLSSTQVANMAASFQKTVCLILAQRLRQAQNKFQAKSIVIAGGVAANSRLREEMTRAMPLPMNYAPLEYCTDNGAMIAAMGYHLALASKTSDPLTMKTDPSLAV